MYTFTKWATMSVLAMTLIACQKKEDKKESNLPTFSEAEYIDDVSRVQAQEANLEGAGFRFEKFTTTTSDSKKIEARWSQSHQNEYLQNHQEKSSEEVYIAALPTFDIYSTMVDAMLAKYQGTFRLKKNDGTTDEMQINNDVRLDLLVKSDLCKLTSKILKEDFGIATLETEENFQIETKSLEIKELELSKVGIKLVKKQTVMGALEWKVDNAFLSDFRTKNPNVTTDQIRGGIALFNIELSKYLTRFAKVIKLQKADGSVIFYTLPKTTVLELQEKSKALANTAGQL